MRKTIILSLVFVITQAFGQVSLDAVYRDGLNAAQSNIQKAIDSINNLNPSEAFKDQDGNSYYTDKPEQIRHYQDVTQGNMDVLDDAGRKSIDQNKATKEIWKSFGNPKITLDPSGADTGWLSKSNDIIKNAADITRGVSGQPDEVVKNSAPAGVNCKEAKICRIELVKKTCNEEANPLKKVCEKVPRINILEQQTEYFGCKNIEVKQGANNRCSHGYSGPRTIFYTDMINGPVWDDIFLCDRSNYSNECYVGYLVKGIYHRNNYDRDPSLTKGRGVIPKKTQGHMRFVHTYHGGLSGTIFNDTKNSVFVSGTFTSGQVIDLPLSYVEDQVFRFSPNNSGQVGVVIIYVDRISKEKVANLEFWTESDCSVTDNKSTAITCSNPKDECVEPGETRYFDGAPYTLPCWKYKTTYECKAESDNNCKPLAADGCSPATTTCKTMWGNICAVQEVTYDCPTRKCDGSEIVCNSGGGFCLTGDCASQIRTGDSDMHKVLSALFAVADAAKDFNKNLTIFKSKPSACSRNAIGFKNCCKEHGGGWGLHTKLAECTGEEEGLAKQKAAGLAAEVGEYCHNDTPLGCSSYHKTYCVFTSKLGRIIRVAAKDQLGLDFGSPEHPNCSGLTREQFGSLNFSKIDFSEFYKDIENKMSVNAGDRSPNNVNKIMQQKSEGLKAKLQMDAQKTKERADELRARTHVK